MFLAKKAAKTSSIHKSTALWTAKNFQSVAPSCRHWPSQPLPSSRPLPYHLSWAPCLAVQASNRNFRCGKHMEEDKKRVFQWFPFCCNPSTCCLFDKELLLQVWANTNLYILRKWTKFECLKTALCHNLVLRPFSIIFNHFQRVWLFDIIPHPGCKHKEYINTMIRRRKNSCSTIDFNPFVCFLFLWDFSIFL